MTCPHGQYKDALLGCIPCDPLCKKSIWEEKLPDWKLKHCKVLCKDVYKQLHETTTTASTPQARTVPSQAYSGEDTTKLEVILPVVCVCVLFVIVLGLVYILLRKKKTEERSRSKDVELGDLAARNPLLSTVKRDATRIRHSSAPGRLSAASNSSNTRSSVITSSSGTSSTTDQTSRTSYAFSTSSNREPLEEYSPVYRSGQHQVSTIPKVTEHPAEPRRHTLRVSVSPTVSTQTDCVTSVERFPVQATDHRV